MCRRPSRVASLRWDLARFRFRPDVITVAIRWYLRYGLSYRDVECRWPNAVSKSTM
jgi:transposase-like protein